MTYIPPVNGGRINATISGNTAGAGALVSTGTLTLAGGNNITLSQNGNAITISGGAGGGAFSVGMSNIGNTSGTTGLASNQLVLAGGNNITLSQSTAVGGNTLSISAASQTVQTQNLHNVSLAGNTSGALAQISSGTLTLAGGNNVTLSQNGNAVTISAGAGGGGGVAVANSQTTFTNGTVNLVTVSGAITINSNTGQSLQFAVPQTSSLAATGGLSISTTGSTISMGVQSPATLSRFDYPEGIFSPLSTVSAGQLSLNHMYSPFNVTGTAIKIGGSLSGNTNTSATTASVNLSLWMGIYTLSGSTLSLASSGSANNGFQWSQSASTSANTTINGVRQMTVPMNINMTPGEYWIGAVMTSATTYQAPAFTLYGNSVMPTAAGAAALTPIGSATTAARDAMLMQGYYSTTTTAGPTSIANSQINNTSASAVMRANFYNAIYNTTY